MTRLVLKRGKLSRSSGERMKTMTCSPMARSSGAFSSQQAHDLIRPRCGGDHCHRAGDSQRDNGRAATLDEAKAKFRAAWEKAKARVRK
jgi:hypothetical protein